ncbi:hypothetical protein M0804_003350 [Polistes exclamans]|nr:hypothetical protein M0804_003350 [Polistes exclamans]
MINENTQFARTKESFVSVIPIKEERENFDNKITEKSPRNKAIKLCQSALCTTTNIPLSKKYKDKIVKGEKTREPYVGFSLLKEIRKRHKQKDSTEKNSDYEFAESLEQNPDINFKEINPFDNKFRENSQKLVCYCRKEDCQDCQSRTKLLASRSLIKNKSKRDKYRETNSNNYKVSKIPSRLSKLHGTIPHELNSNYGNYKQMQYLPIIHGIPPHVYPLTVPFRVTYEQVEPPIGMNTPISQQYQQNSINNQQTPLKQHIVATKNPSEIHEKLSTLIPKEEKRNNDFSTTMNYPDHEESDLNSEKEIDEDSFDANMLKCIELYGRKVCMLAAATACKSLNKNNNEKEVKVGSILNYYDTLTTEQSSTYDNNDKYYDYDDNIMTENGLDGDHISTELSTANYNKDYYDFSTSNVISETSNYVITDSYRTSNDDSLIKQSTTYYTSGEDYNDSKTPEYSTVDSTEISLLQTTQNSKEQNQLSTTLTSLLIDYDVTNESNTDSSPSTYDYNLSKDSTTNLINDSPYVQTTNIPEITDDQTNSQDVLSTKSYSNSIENSIPIDSIIGNTLNTDETTTEYNDDVLRREHSLFDKNQEDENNDPENKAALKDDTYDSSSFTSTEKSEQTTIDLFLKNTMSDDYPTDISNEYASPNVITSPIESSEIEEESTINDFTVSSTLPTTNELKLQTNNQQYLTSSEKTTTTEITIEKVTHGETNNPNEVESMKLSENFDTTLNPVTIIEDHSNIDNEISVLEKTSNDDVESTTHYLPFCDNKQLVNSIKTVINHFSSKDVNLEDLKDFNKTSDKVELSPEIVGIPRLRSLLSLTPIENVIIKKVKDHLSTNFGIPRNALHDEGASNVIRDTFRNTLNLLPNMQSELPPMTVEEHQFHSGHWTTNLVTLLPLTSSERKENHDISRRLRDHLKSLIYHPAIGLESAKHNTVQNIIIQTAKHQLENADDTKIDENTIRDILGSVLQDNETTYNYETTTEIVISTKDDNQLESFESTTDNLLTELYYEDFKTNKELSTTDVNEIQTNNYSNDIRDSYVSSTEFYGENVEEDQESRGESTPLFETTSTRNVANINEEIPGISKPEEQSNESSSNKEETNESEVLRLPQNSFVGVSNPRIGETTSASIGGSLQDKKKCPLCKIENNADTREIVTNFNKGVQTTIDYYGSTDASFERNPIVSKASKDDITNSSEKRESQEDVNERNDDDSTTYKNFIHRDSNSEENFTYENEMNKKQMNDIDNSERDLSELQNSEIYYVNENVKFPLEIKKLEDGSYVLLISKKICENVLQKNCPCYVPIEGNIRLIKRSTAEINNDNDYALNNQNNEISDPKSAIIKSRSSKQRILRSTIFNTKLDDLDDNNVEIVMLPVVAFAKTYNLRLNLDDMEKENDMPNQLKRINKIDKNNVDVRLKKKLLERSNEIIKDDDNVKETEYIYKDKNEERKKNNPVFQRMKFIKKMQKNREPFRQQRAIKQNSTKGTDVLKSLVNWLRTLFVE